MDYYSFTDIKGMEGWVGVVSYPQLTFHQKSGHMSTVDQAYIRKSLLEKDQRQSIDESTMNFYSGLSIYNTARSTIVSV